jgi:hypothetical protein
MQNIIQIQQEFIDRCVSLPSNGHAWRGEWKARKVLEKKLLALGLGDTEALKAFRDAQDMVKLERSAL